MSIFHRVAILGLLAVSVGSAGAAQIDMMSPAEGAIGTRITILGSGFGSGKAKVLLTGSGKAKARVVQASDTQIVADVKSAKAGSYTVVVKGAGGEVTAPQPFLVRVPSNLTFDPPCPDPGTIVTMRGRFLGSKKGTVKVGGKKAKVTSWNADQLGDGSATLKLHKKTPRGAANVSIKTKAGTANVVQALGIGSSGQCFVTQTTTTTTPGASTTSTTLPAGTLRVVSAIADSSTTVLVTFSEPIDVPSGSDPSHYAVTTSLLSPDSPVGGQIRLPIDTPEVLDGNKTVRLTTCSQSQAKYNLKVGPVLDVLGRPITPPVLGNPDPSSAAFVGTPGAESDADVDGLSDATECLGWIVRTTGVDPDGPKGPEQAEIIRREVSSDRALPDTDGDGISDLTEQQRKFNPREADSDTDELTDYQEWNELFSDATRQDSDGDGLDDGVEFNFLRTSPIKADSDGDQVDDGDELATANRNPRVAELPTPAIEIGAIHAELNLSFEATSTAGTRKLKGRDLTTDLTQSSERAFTSTSKESHEVFAKLGVETTLNTEIAVDPKVKIGVKVNVEAGWTGNWTNEWTQASKTNTETKYSEALKSEDEIQSGETLVRKIDGAKITTAVTLRNLSDVSFSMKNVTIAAFVQDPKSTGRLTLLASLVPVTGVDTVFEIGPGDEKGPVEFENSDVFPATVDALLRDQRGVVFKISTFTLTDENGRTFNYVEQDVTELTSRLLIDFGGRDSGVDRDGDGVDDRTEQHRVATLVGRDLGNGHFAIYDGNGKPLGITLPQALEAAGLTRYGRSQDATLTPTQKRNSYSTYVDANGFERIWRIRDVARSNLSESIWLVVDNDGVTSELNLDEYVLRGGADGARDIRLAFLEDKDGDGLPAPVEHLNGCSDNDSDTDDDGLPDRLEVAVGWEIFVRDKAGSGARRVYSRCNSTDSDGDGLSDISEFSGVQYGDKFCTAALPCPSDPLDIDTDHDGLLDHNKLCAPGVSCNETAFATNLADYDSDGDSLGIGDANEIALGGNPRVADPGNFADDDNDFVPNVVEQSCARQIEFEGVATCTLAGGCSSGKIVVQPCPLSDKSKKDTDGDGLDDGEELELGLNPSNKDTDGDGIQDKAELGGVDIRDCQDKAAKALLDPLDADWDDDGLSDGGEVTGWRVQANDAPTHTLVSSDPQAADCDDDDLPDGLEALADRRSHDSKNCNVAAPPAGCIPYGTDPRTADTDGDGRRDSTEYGSAVTDPLVKDREVTVDFQKLVFAQCNVGEDASSPDGNYGAAEAIVELGVKLPGTQQETILLSPLAQVAGLPFFTPTLTSVNWSGGVCVARSDASSYLQHGCVDMVKLLSGTNASGGTGLLGIQMWHVGDEPFRSGCSNRPGSVYLDDTRKISFPMKEQANQCFTITGEFSEFDGPYPISHNDDTYTDTDWYLDEQPWFFLDFGAPGKQPTLPQVCWGDLQTTVGQTHRSRLLYSPTEPQYARWIDVDITVR
jgi:hypothetical protein